MFGIGPSELVLVLVIVILLFGAKKIPELARGLGRGLGEFRKAKEELDEPINGVKDTLVESGVPVRDKRPRRPASRST